MKVDPDNEEIENAARWERIQQRARENRRAYARELASKPAAKPKDEERTHRHKSRRSGKPWIYNPAQRD